MTESVKADAAIEELIFSSLAREVILAIARVYAGLSDLERQIGFRIDFVGIDIRDNGSKPFQVRMRRLIPSQLVEIASTGFDQIPEGLVTLGGVDGKKVSVLRPDIVSVDVLKVMEQVEDTKPPQYRLRLGGIEPSHEEDGEDEQEQKTDTADEPGESSGLGSQTQTNPEGLLSEETNSNQNNEQESEMTKSTKAVALPDLSELKKFTTKNSDCVLGFLICVYNYTDKNKEPIHSFDLSDKLVKETYFDEFLKGKDSATLRKMVGTWITATRIAGLVTFEDQMVLLSPNGDGAVKSTTLPEGLVYRKAKTKAQPEKKAPAKKRAPAKKKVPAKSGKSKRGSGASSKAKTGNPGITDIAELRVAVVDSDAQIASLEKRKAALTEELAALTEEISVFESERDTALGVLAKGLNVSTEAMLELLQDRSE